MVLRSVFVASAAVWAGVVCAMEPIDLNGLWDFRLAKDASLEEVVMPDFKPDGTMVVPDCWDAMSHWYNQRGTDLYRRPKFVVEAIRKLFHEKDEKDLPFKLVPSPQRLERKSGNDVL